MSKIHKTLSSAAIWVLFITGLTSILVPVILGVTSGSLAGGIDSVDAGKLWFYQHGLSFLIGIAAFVAFFYAIRSFGSLKWEG